MTSWSLPSPGYRTDIDIDGRLVLNSGPPCGMTDELGQPSFCWPSFDHQLRACCLRRLKRSRPSLTSLWTFETKHFGHISGPAHHTCLSPALSYWEQVCLFPEPSHAVSGWEMRSSSSRKQRRSHGLREAARMNPTQSRRAAAVESAGPILARGSTSSPSLLVGAVASTLGCSKATKPPPLAPGPGPRSKVQVRV